MKPFSVSWLNPGLLISNTYHTLYFFPSLQDGEKHSQENMFWHKKVYSTGSYWVSAIWSEHFDMCLLHEHFQQHLCEPPMQIPVFRGGTGCTPTVQLLLLLLPGNIQYFIVQLCSGAEQKWAFHLTSSYHTSILVCLYVRIYTSVKWVVEDHLLSIWVAFYNPFLLHSAFKKSLMCFSKHPRVAPFHYILLLKYCQQFK